MKKLYINPSMEVLHVECDDMITTSIFIKVENRAVDDYEKRGDGLSSNQYPDGLAPTEAKRNTGFFGVDDEEEW